jgi:hypothetical protein
VTSFLWGAPDPTRDAIVAAVKENNFEQVFSHGRLLRKKLKKGIL